MQYQPSIIAEWLRQRRRLIVYVLSFVVIVGIQTVVYWWGMETFEGDPRSLLDSLGVVVQSLTTTGYGQDAPWDSTFVSLLVIVMQFTGVAYLFIAFPLFIVPWMREAVEGPRASKTVGRLRDHVVLLGHSSVFSTFIEDLERQDTRYVVIEGDPEQARELDEQDLPVVQANPTSTETLTDVSVAEARGVVIDARDDGRIGAVLTVREVTEDVEIICVVEDPGRSQYLRYAGATKVLSPKHRLGKAMADKVRDVVRTDESARDLNMTVADFPLGSESSLHGQALFEIDAIDETGATLVGAWIRGQFVPRFATDYVVDQNTVLVAAGTDDQLERVAQVTDAAPRTLRDGPVIIAGYGIIGTTADGILRKSGYDTTTIDADEGSEADIAGDVADPETLPSAGVEDAAMVLLALSDDDSSIRATLVASQRHDVDVIVAANEDENVSKLYRGGADYVLSLPRLAGRMVISELFDMGPLPLQEEVRLAVVEPGEAVGSRPSVLTEETNVVVLAVQRDGTLIEDVGQDFELRPGDEVVVAGPSDAVETLAAKDTP